MNYVNRKIGLDGIQGNSGSARKILSYSDFQKSRLKNHELRFKSNHKISNTQYLISNKISNFKIKIKNRIFGFWIFVSNWKLGIRNLIKSYYLKKLTAITVILAVLISVYFQSADNARSATYTWSQMTWTTTPPASSGACSAAGGTWTGTECVATHDNNQSSWATYGSKDGFLSSGTELALSLTNTTSGQTTNAQFGTGTTSQTLVANDSVALESYGPVATSMISGGKSSTCALSETGAVYCWGINTNGELGDGTNNQSLTPVQVVKGVAASGDYSGSYLANIKTISSGLYYYCAVSNNDNVYCWGYNSSGQLGDNDPGVSKNSPIRVLAGAAASGDYSGSYLANIKSVSAGDGATCAVSNNDNIYCWGDNTNGRLGDGTINNRNTPVRVLAGAAASGDYSGAYLSNIKEVEIGQTHTCAVSNQDNPYCWGSNGLGKLGDGTTNNSNTPVRIVAGAAASGDYSGSYLNNVSHISTGNTHTCAVSGQNNPYCWGSGNYGQLGNNSTNASNPSPVRVLMGEAAGTDNDTINLTNIANIATNLEGTQKNTCAYSNIGNAYCWGRYSYGQVGTNTSGGGNYLTPKRVLKGGADAGDNDGTYLNNIKNISINGAFACAVSNNNYAYCWGEGGSGQLGDNNALQRNIPVQVSGVGGSGYLSLAAATTYATSGTFVSGVINTNYNVASWGSLSWTATLNGQTIQMKARSCDDAACSGEDATKPFGGDTDAEWDNVDDICNTITSGQMMSTGNCMTSGERYLQYAARLKTADTSTTPTLDDVGYGYYRYFNEQFLYSSEYDTTDSTNVLSSIAWSEILGVSNTDVQFQVRTSADGTTWSNWCGPDNGTTGCATGTYFTDPAGGETVDADFTDSTDDQWIQYKARLTSSTGQYTPTLSDVTMTYVVNAAPTVTVNSAVQNSDGTIAINYDLSDTDDSSFTVSAYADLGITLNETLDSSDTTITLSATTLLPAAGTIMLDSEQITYTGKSGNDLTSCTRGANSTRAAAHSSGAAAWAKATTAAGNIGASQSAGAGKTITWTINTDYDGAYRNSSQGKIRVSANDLNLANQVGNGDSSAFAIDTKNPTGFAISSIDHTQNQVVITAATEDSNYEVYIGNASGTLFDAGNITSPLLNQASSYPNTYTYSSMTSDPATVFVGVKDAKGNTAYTQMTTPAKPTNPIYYDTSSEPQGIYQEFLAWDVVSAAQVGSGWSAYKIYRKINSGSYSLLATITDRSTNYYLDKIFGTDTESDPSFDVNNPSAYTYKITTSDTAGNISAYSTTVSDTPNGTGGSDSTAPTISNVTVSNINTTSATITWDTDELSSSYVGYSTDTSYLPERGLASMVTSHEITLTGLDSDTTYNIRIKSYDAIGNLGQNDKDSPGNNVISDFTFDTLAGPEISSVTVVSNNTNATVSWATTTDSDTYVVYTDTLDDNGAMVNAEEVGVPDFVGGSPSFNHSQNITTFNDLPLVSGDTYYFYVKSTDASIPPVTAIDNNGGSFYSFSTTQDDDDPILGTPSAVVRNNTQAVISWTTNEGANSTVNYGTTSGNLTFSSSVATYDTSHYVILSALSPNVTYYYTVTSADINTNSDTSTEYSFTTLRDPEEQHDPLTSITMLYNTGGAAGDPKVLTDTKAVIAFNTDQPALCTIEYGTIAGSFTEVPVAETSYNENHSVHLTGLIFSTKYYYRITCEDNLDTAISSSEYNFTTSAQLQTSGEWGAGQTSDTTAPEISSISATGATGESVIVKWSTNEKASSYVRYGTTTDFGSMAGNDLVNADKINYATAHEVTVNNLIPSTKYYYTVISIDAAGNIGESGQNSLTTKSPSGITSVKAESKSLGEAVFTWSTSKDMTSIVDYGLTTSYSESKESTAKIKEHEISISGLISGQTYHFRVKGKDGDNNLYSSNDYTFDPKSPPQISDIRVEAVSEHSAKVLFASNIPTDALVTYSDPLDDKNSGSKGTPEMATSHEVELLNLVPGTAYSLTIKVKDEQGNETENAKESFTTGKDENPPAIDKIKTDSALTQGDKVQAIVSWETNEPATANIIYKEGKNGEEKSVLVDENYVLGHIAVVTAFKSGTVYYFKVKASDKAGNEAVSGEYAVLTPKRKENIIQVITNTFQDVFSWARF